MNTSSLKWRLKSYVRLPALLPPPSKVSRAVASAFCAASRPWHMAVASVASAFLASLRSLTLMRGVFFAEEDNYKSYYIDNIFNSIWQDGLNMNDENIIQKVLKNLNVNPKTFALRATSSAIKDSLKRKTSEAYEKGIFGAPTFVSNNKIFWGQDRIEFVLKEASK